VLSLAAAARAAGQSLLDRWDALEAAHGVHLTAQVSLHAPSPAGIMRLLRAAPPAALAGHPVTSTDDLSAGPGGSNHHGGAGQASGPDGAGEAGSAGEPSRGGRPDGAGGPGLPPADVLIYRLPGARVVVRPSGTEPKLKVYLEIVEPATAETLAAARAAAAGRLGPLRAAVADLVAAAPTAWPGDTGVPTLG
jgi:phosphomannomutase